MTQNRRKLYRDENDVNRFSFFFDEIAIIWKLHSFHCASLFKLLVHKAKTISNFSKLCTVLKESDFYLT